MLNTLGIVEVATDVCPSESYLDIGQIASARFGGTTLIDWVLRRLTDSQCLDGVIAVLEQSVVDQVAQFVPPDVPIFITDLTNSLDRIVAAVERFPAKSVVRVGLCMPFIDPNLIDRLISAANNNPECDYLTYRSMNGEMSTVSQLGLVAEWCRVGALRRAQKSTGSCPALSLTEYIAQNAGIFKTRFLQVPDALDREDIRLTLTDRTDLENAEEIYEALGPEHLDWQRIATLLDQQPALRRQMASLNRAHALNVSD